MFTKFYDNTIITKFIKELVAKTNVPFISTWKPGDFVIRGMLYLTKDTIWKCLHTGWPKHINDICPEDHIAYKLVTNPEDLRFFTRVSPYVFGEEYYNITGKYESKILGYDSITHQYLGQYLRLLRDVYDLDLMPFYNCFANEYVADIDFNAQGQVFSASSKNSIYKILSVPVHFGKTYMLAINSDLPVECICAVYGSKGFIKDLTDNLNSINSSGVTADSHNTYLKFQRLQFESPILYRTVDWHQLYSQPDLDEGAVINDNAYDQRLGQYEKYLRLLIKIPKSNKSSVVVIEGDYPVIEVEGSDNTPTVTWSNQYLKDTTINSKTVTGDWIRPEVIKNFNNKEVEEYAFKLTIRDNIDISIPFFDRTIHFTKNYVFPKDTPHGLRMLIVFRLAKNQYIKNKYGDSLIDTSKIHISGTCDDIILNIDTSKPTKEILFSPLGLLLMSDGNIYAFSDRLIEYLVLNVINHLDLFSKDIERVLQYSKSEINLLKNGSRYVGNVVPGVWDKDFQEYLFDLTKNSTLLSRKIDLTGNVDKDTESVITRGQKM